MGCGTNDDGAALGGLHNARRNRLFVPRDLARSFDQRRERAQRLCDRKERVLRKLRRIWPLFSINLQRLG